MIKCILGILLTAAAYAAGRYAWPVFERMGLDPIACVPAVRSVVAVAGILALGGASWLRFRPRNVRSTWKYAWFMILINVILAASIAYRLYAKLQAGELDTKSALYWFGYSTVLCILVGINEECMFRGLLLGGLLAGFGGKKNGPLIAALVSSIAFGAIHVIFDMDTTNIYSIGTGLMKTLETAMFALILCYPTIDGKSLWGAITAHAFFDWIILCGSTVANGGMEAPTYVSSDPESAMVAMAFFGVVALLYLPKTIRAIKDLRDMELPQYGPFIEG